MNTGPTVKLESGGATIHYVIKDGSKPAAKRRGRGCLTWLAGGVILVAGLLLAGALYEPAAEAADDRAYPPPGQLVDVGGYRLHMNCTGTGSPTVVIDAGWGDWSTMWGLVQPNVAQTTRVCTYDRAGSGWSEDGPLPRNARQFAKELHTLLNNAGVPGPYVLVGHSMGGLTMRVYTHDYPADVAGVVLIESMSPGQFTSSAASAQPPASAQSRAFSIPTVLARVGLVRLLARPLGLVPHVPDENAYLSRFVRPQYLQAYLGDEGKGMPESGAQAAAVKTFGDLPLLVLSRGLDPQQDWIKMQTELLQLSSNSQQLFAEKSGHNIEIDQPQAAVAAIVKMVEQVRRQID